MTLDSMPEPNTTSTTSSVKGADRGPRFQRTLQAARALWATEGRLSELQWALGDALIAECGPPGADGVHTGSDKLIERARKFLLAAGIDYSSEHLRDFRQVAHAFAAGARSPAEGWTVHRAAGNIETLEGARKFAKDKKLTVKLVEKFKAKRNADRDKNSKTDLDLAIEDFLDEAMASQASAQQATRGITPHLQQLPPERRSKLIAAAQKAAADWTAAALQLKPRGDEFAEAAE